MNYKLTIESELSHENLNLIENGLWQFELITEEISKRRMGSSLIHQGTRTMEPCKDWVNPK